ncbi:ATP-binding protein [Bacteroides thetaiotaomicron]|uniref:PAS domain-containing sensor histidine kinase n=1 Tax=Bacteroides thetaiotaomicron TaxID=818 RepID=UPI00232C481D|nr:PAS domain-containing hybrid sensor histidine kinase/response regulator [Bacteroides thetaiotaomicron]MDC2010041.1 ATP-binding protein [Bacteroides thetaiotaomicron]MDC2022267.1 ATP-binding protein [Bacteroides thetaiotaomicron]MDC2027357.1 ATP-binding protein [Bacteroides thetaiotaomicron]MDC2031226.1 ATP-binding protein [Bacteroides thetaiotaomicron]MDC2062093.1 ATP-binding protein [Bacteroides thetaiotaomicron]
MGWWEADLKTESYICSEFISRLLGIDEDGVISFENFNKRILREDQHHTTSYSFDKLQQSIEEVYLLHTPHGEVWIRSKICFQETDEEGNTKIYGIAETQDGPHMASAYQALQNSERILHNIYKNLPVGIELYNKDGYLLDLNKKELEMFHITHKEKVIGINIFENPALPEEIKLKIRDNEEVEFTFQYDFSKIKGYYESEKTSGFINLTTRITTLYDHDRQPINYLLINVDKTENTIAYNKIQEFKNFFELVGDYAKVGYAHFDALSRNGYALSSWYKNVGEEEGTPLPEIIGIHSHFHPEDRAVMLDFLAKVVKGESTKLCRDVRIRRADGSYTWTRVNVLVRNYRPQDNVIEMLCINFDITQLKETEQMLIKAKEKAEEADRLKSAFLANMSHEIRTPLNAIVGFSSMLEEAEDQEEKHQYITIIEDNNKLLLQLISDILDLSKIEAETFDIIPERVNAKQLCNDLFQAMQMKTSPQVELRLKDNLPELTFTSDKNRLYQVLLNFVTNALKFTSEGNITIDYQIDGNEVKFSVQDTGMGIEPEKQEAIFTRFVKLNSFIPGTGLGLSICQSIVTQLGGKIGVESEPGKGSCFWFTHPIN